MWILLMINWLKKNELILWKLSSIQMKILNDITYNLNWIDKFQIELNSNFIEKKRNANLWERYSKYAHEYGVEK